MAQSPRRRPRPVAVAPGRASIAARRAAVAVAWLAVAAGCEVNVPSDRAAYAYADRTARLAASCDPKAPGACDDANPCTTDSCSAQDGCTYAPAQAACSDGDACTTGDACAAGKCAGTLVNCDDGSVCTSDACDAQTGCVATAIGGVCDDGSACTNGDACAGGACVGTALSCDDDNPCTTNGCDPKAGRGGAPCTFAAHSDPCDDGDPCTGEDRCKAGACAGAAMDCSAAEPCTVEQTCSAGACVGGKPKVCSDGDACTDDSCDPAKGCAFVPAAGGCDDGNACTTDVCDAQTGCQSSPAPEGGACDDGDPCTLPGACKAGKCVAAGLTCTTDAPCHTAFCASKTGACTVKVDTDGASCAAKQGVCGGGHCVASGGNGAAWGLVPAGTFWMGCNATLDPSCANDEQPQHQVTVTAPYWLGVDEVTTAQYAACVTAGVCKPAATFDARCNGGKPGREQHPINCVPWSEAQAYCQWIGGALPTEAQWELAARGRCDENGGATSCKAAMRVYAWGATAPVCGAQGVFAQGGAGCGKDQTAEVGKGSAAGVGPYGMRDMAGNVWEWVADWSAAYEAAAVSGATGGIGPATGSARAARGGAFTSSAAELRASARGAGGAAVPIVDVGFRCAKPVQ